jgi:hypothetical protein
MAIAIRATAIGKDDGGAVVEPARGADPLRTECLTPLALTLGLIMWALIIAIVRL